MKRLYKLLITLTLSVCCLLSFTACSAPATVDDTTLVDPRVETIKVGIIEYEPLNYMSRNTFKGFNPELALMTFEALGYNVKFVLVKPQNTEEFMPTAQDVYDALDSGDIDCFWGGISDAILFDEERADFSLPYLKNSLCLVKGTYANSISSLEDLENAKVAVAQNTVGEKYFNEQILGTISGASALTCKRGHVEALHKIKAVTDSTSYAIIDTLSALYHKYNGDYSNVVITEIDLAQENNLRVVFKKQNDKNELRDNVNAMLNAFSSIKTDEKCIITKIAEKYKFGSYDKNLSDFIITDFSIDTETGGGASEGSGLTSNPIPNPQPEPPQGSSGSNTEGFKPGWLS